METAGCIGPKQGGANKAWNPPVQGFPRIPKELQSYTEAVFLMSDSDASLGATKLVQSLQLTDKPGEVNQLFSFPVSDQELEEL